MDICECATCSRAVVVGGLRCNSCFESFCSRECGGFIGDNCNSCHEFNKRENPNALLGESRVVERS